MTHQHGGHRTRLRKRFTDEGLTHFAPHEVLELLLCYAIPQKDVNPLAHALLDRFGSLHRVLEATPNELMEVEGIGEYAAGLLTMMPQLLMRYQLSRSGDRPQLDTRGAAVKYCKALLAHARYEQIYAVCLDTQMRVEHACLIGSGTLDETPAYPRLAVEGALRYKAHSVVLTHNHPSGVLVPSKEDIQTTQRIVDALYAIDVQLLDHILVNGEDHLSMVQAGYISHNHPVYTQQGARRPFVGNPGDRLPAPSPALYPSADRVRQRSLPKEFESWYTD